MYAYILKNNRNVLVIAAVLGIMVASTLFVPVASAVAPLTAQPPAAGPDNAPGTGQALEISPPVMNLTADPGQTITRELNLRDVSTGKLVVTGEVNDFMADGEEGIPKLLLEAGEDSPYSLKAWVAPLPRMTLDPKQVRSLPITIKVPANAAPGGYYGVIRFTATPPELEGQGVSLSASLGSLVLLTVNGDAKEGLEVEEYKTLRNGQAKNIFESKPINFLARLKNTGRVHQQPLGKITVKDMFGKHVADTFFNQPPRNILPDSIRKFEVALDETELGKKMLFGRYTADLTVTYGSKDQTTTDTLTFWVIPYRLIALVIIALVGLFFLLRFALKQYTQRVLRGSRGSRNRRR
jgi:hypothetical protein